MVVTPRWSDIKSPEDIPRYVAMRHRLLDIELEYEVLAAFWCQYFERMGEEVEC